MIPFSLEFATCGVLWCSCEGNIQICYSTVQESHHCRSSAHLDAQIQNAMQYSRYDISTLLLQNKIEWSQRAAPTKCTETPSPAFSHRGYWNNDWLIIFGRVNQSINRSNVGLRCEEGCSSVSLHVEIARSPDGCVHTWIWLPLEAIIVTPHPDQRGKYFPRGFP